MYLYDYHMHSVNSSDGKNTISEMCVKAIASGLKEIAVTDHFEPSSGNEKYPYYKPGSYFLDMLKARLVYGKEIKIKYAVELGQPHLYPEYSQKLIEAYPYDYVLASIHRMRDNRDFGDIAYNPENVYFYCIKYLNELKSLAQWNKFDCIGHLDLVKRYASNFCTKANFMDYKERLEEILKILIQNGKGIEINTSGLRQSADECLPGLDIISFYRKLGGEIITVGSDAHIAEDVGKGINEAIEIAKLAGFYYITVYTNRQPFMIKISERSSIRHFSKQPA
ncbi:MAG: histidinol phosphate phosphatase [Clostridiales bacterium GWC2_40_7]|nr:MAG: histidinol phosphate phosphatase [Clostridiales bacterium GWC2_40_7]